MLIVLHRQIRILCTASVHTDPLFLPKDLCQLDKAAHMLGIIVGFEDHLHAHYSALLRLQKQGKWKKHRGVLSAGDDPYRRLITECAWALRLRRQDDTGREGLAAHQHLVVLLQGHIQNLTSPRLDSTPQPGEKSRHL